MKRMLALALAGALVLGLTACGTAAKKDTETGDTAEVTVVGGWTVQDSGTAAFSEDVQKVFDDAAGQWDGIGMKAVALLSTQVVAGTNYCFLAQTSDGYVLVYAYKDLEDNVELTKVYDIDLTAETYGEADEQMEAGGWTVAEENYAAPSADDQAVLDDAQAEMTGAGYTLIATLGTQVVSGTNYLMLCKETTVTAEPFESYSIVKVYKNLDGTAEITDVLALPVAEISQAE